MKLGIENVKLFVGLGFKFGKQTETALADGQFTTSDAFGYLDELMEIPNVASHSKEELAEALDLDSDERTEINLWAKKEFDLKNDEVEEKVDASLDFAVSALIFYRVWKPKPATPQ